MFIFKDYCLKISKLNKVFLTIILFLSYPNLSSAPGISSVSYIEPIPLRHMPLRTGFTPILPTDGENALEGIQLMPLKPMQGGFFERTIKKNRKKVF